jgi:hypothetical protein
MSDRPEWTENSELTDGEYFTMNSEMEEGFISSHFVLDHQEIIKGFSNIKSEN